MSRIVDLADRAAARDRALAKRTVQSLMRALVLAARHLDSRAARDFVRTIAVMLPSLVGLCAPRSSEPDKSRRIADIYNAIQTALERAAELRAEGRALLAELGLPIFAPLFADHATAGILDLPSLFTEKALADLADRFKIVDR